MQIQISWLLQKPTNLDLHCLLRQSMSCSAREGLRIVRISKKAAKIKWAEVKHFLQDVMYAQQWIRSACTSTQTDQSPVSAWSCFGSITKTRLFKYTENFTTKNGNFSDKKYWYFSYFCSKHRLWVVVWTALVMFEPPHQGGSNKYPQSMFLSRNKKNNLYPCKPQLYYIKVGFERVKII